MEMPKHMKLPDDISFAEQVQKIEQLVNCHGPMDTWKAWLFIKNTIINRAAEQPNNGMELTSAPQAAGSVKYETALLVFKEYIAFQDECESHYQTFPQFCQKHLTVGA